MKFAHIRVSEYFTFAEQIFHSEAISLARRANFTEKSQVLRLGFFLGTTFQNRSVPQVFRNRSVVFGRWVDLSLGGDGSST